MKYIQRLLELFFTNIGTLLFDWKIRQAFSRSQVPNLELISSKYSLDRCEICQIMFPDDTINKKLTEFSNHLKYQSLKDKRFQTEQELIKFEKEHRRSRSYMTLGLSMFFVIILCILFNAIDSSIFNMDIDYLNAELVILFLLTVIIVITVTLLLSKNSINVRRTYEKQLKYIDNEMKKLEDLKN